jgi:hypothetical protein
MTDRKQERRAPKGGSKPPARDTHPNADSADDPEFRGYRPNLPGGEEYRGPEQPSDPRPQSPDDPEFKSYRPAGEEQAKAGKRPAPADDDEEDEEDAA